MEVYSLMLRKLVLLAAGGALTVLGLVGLVLPLMPGLLLLAAAAACFSLASPGFRYGLERRLSTHPRGRRALARWRSARHLPLTARMRLAFWLTLQTLVPERRR